MVSGNQNQEPVPEGLRKQLALAVRSIQWSYAIFWSMSSTQPGALEWGDGYYNGDIKTRKTVQAVELNADQLGLQRSEQLRELYGSLSAGEANPQAKRPSAALSPEDLTDTEWYYLVCMSFVFNVGQGLPGRTLAKNQITWLCNAHRADTKVFSRALLAKSAAIQTVVCFPHLGGVIELGVTEHVSEDESLIQQIKTSFLDTPLLAVPEIPNHVSTSNGVNYNELVYSRLDYGDMPENCLNELEECHEFDISSPNNSSNGFGANQLKEVADMVEGVNADASQLQSWQFIDDELSNCINSPMNSSDCVSQTHCDPENIVSTSNGNKAIDNCVQDNLECNQQKNPTDIQTEDVHYQGVLSTLLKSSQQLILGPHFRNSNKESSFVSWKRNESHNGRMSQNGGSQKLLKKVLFEVAKMHKNCERESRKQNGKKDGLFKPEADEIDRNHVLSERKRREKINERFMILGSLIPSGGKADKVSILDNTIEYLRELEKRVEELESSKDVSGLDAGTRLRFPDASERTSDNGGTKKDGTSKKQRNKRKASDVDEVRAESNRVDSGESSADHLTINIIDKEVLLEIRCPWRDCLLLEVMEAINRLHLDSHTVQSSNNDGILFLIIMSKFKGSKVASAGVIRQTLQRVIRRK